MRCPGLLFLLLLSAPTWARPVPGHHLPEGAEQSVREREVDIGRLEADLHIDLKRQRLSGSITVTLSALRSDLHTVHFDAADPVVSKVELLGRSGAEKLSFDKKSRLLAITLPPGIEPGQELKIRIHYSAQPDSGLYFFAQTGNESAEAWNYGEGGRHYGWLPLYNDTNDRFSVDFRISVAKPYRVLANGTLIETLENPDGSRTFHWVQEQPIPNYLLALDVGEFVAVPLRSATVGARKVPLTVWTHRGDEASAAFSFGATPAMVEFFSSRFGYDYAWDKYDQVTPRNFSSAMETTTMVGFAPYSLSYQGGPQDNGPELNLAFPGWTTEDTIAHELAHHWFGDLLTCRSLASLWLNESFATFAHTVWNGHAHGEDDLTYQRWRYLNHYLDFVRESGVVRPLEYSGFDVSDDMYTTEITYFKGALVLHMLRRILGDANFYPAISMYLNRHQFAEVESRDFQRALEDASGRNLDWFFNDWIRGGGGYPALQVSWLWVPERNAVDLTLEQVQAELPFENLFDLPIEVEIRTAGGSRTHRVRLNKKSLSVALPVDGKPLMVTVDKGNWLVADIHQEETLQELVYKLEHGDLASALRTARQLAQDHARKPAALEALSRVLADGSLHWGLRQEAALDLGSMGGDVAGAALVAGLGDADQRIRRAVVVALGLLGGARGAAALEKAIEQDPSEEVVGAAAVALGTMQAPRADVVLQGLLERDARYYDVFRLAALQGLAELEDKSHVPTFARHIGPAFNQGLRLAAIDGWSRAAPQDPDLAAALKTLARDPDYTIRGAALDALGELHHAGDMEFLSEYAKAASDRNLQKRAREAAKTIREFAGKR
ncbi:MAG: HEAT repeat domain-containing protein [Gammaproteobacteria bacterium]|nr:HEAT repeat domain-containing protein [Gammaproteobacteria bacterium]